MRRLTWPFVLSLMLSTLLLASCSGKPTIVGQWIEAGSLNSSYGSGTRTVGAIKFDENGTFKSGEYTGTYRLIDDNHMTMTWNRSGLQPLILEIHYILGRATLKLTVQKTPGYSVLPREIAFPTDLERFHGRLLDAPPSSSQNGY